MLQLPEIGLSRSIKTHNVDVDILCDWIEGNVLFIDDELSKVDIIDALCDGYIYADQDFASVLVNNAWAELRKRQKWVGVSSPLQIKSNYIHRKLLWDKSPAYSFCLMLALLVYYKRWAKGFGSDYSAQGHLFQELTSEALRLYGWETFSTGWIGGMTKTTFDGVVATVAENLNEPRIRKDMISEYSESKEAGLDLVCHKSFVDRRGGRPIYFIQCASGADWREKVKTKAPDLDVWKRMITFSCDPQRGFAMPFSLQDNEFFKTCNRVNGLLIDRYRLLSASGSNGVWLSKELETQIIVWLKPRINSLPTDEL